MLYDRPNTNDQVTGGTLTFSDGSTVNVPTLNNNGAATTVTFPAKTTTSVLFTVLSVSSTTQNVGLSEIEVFRRRAEAATTTRRRRPMPGRPGGVHRCDRPV